MKTLVVHPYDFSTLELEAVYRQRPVDLLHTREMNSGDVEEVLSFGLYDRVILLGHGTPEGLCNMRTKEYVFDHTTYRRFIEPRHVEVIAIWCNADQFFQKYGCPENVFSTGMFVSELSEARDYCLLDATYEEINKQFLLFSEVMRTAAYLPMNQIIHYINEHYIGDDEVTKFNRRQMGLE